MTENNGIEIALFILGIIGWFLRNWNTAQEKKIAELDKKHDDNATVIADMVKTVAKMSLQQDQIAILFKRHDENADGLHKLEIAIADGHYKKGELDLKFGQLDSTIRDTNRELIRKIDEISNKFYENNHCEKAGCK